MYCSMTTAKASAVDPEVGAGDPEGRQADQQRDDGVGHG